MGKILGLNANRERPGMLPNPTGKRDLVIGVATLPASEGVSGMTGIIVYIDPDCNVVR